MATITKPGGATDRKWFKKNSDNSFFDTKLGEADEAELSADSGNYTVVTTYDTDSKAATVTPTTMP